MNLTRILFAVMVIASASHADWPRFRGPAGGGVDFAAKTPDKFTPDDIAWKVTLPGYGHASPVIIGPKIFIPASNQTTGERFAMCLDLATGKVLWKKAYPSRAFKQHNDNSLASASAAADAAKVIFSFTTPESYKLYCLDHAGNELWTYDMGPWDSEHGAGSSPVLWKDLVFLANDQKGPTASLVALDAATGKEKWKIARNPGATASSTPAVFDPPGGAPQLLITSSASGLTSIDPLTGKVNWVVAMNSKLRCVGSVAVSDSYAAAMCGVGGQQRLGVVIGPDPKNASKEPRLLHKIPAGAAYPYVPTPVFKGDLMFLWSDAGTATCLKATTGEQLWQQKVGGDFYASPIIAGDKLYNVSKKGQVICLSASETFAELGRSELGDGSYATPAIAGKKMIFRTFSQILCVGKD